MTQASPAHTGAGDRIGRMAALAAPWLVGVALLALFVPAARQFGGLVPLMLFGLAALGAVVTFHPLVSFSFYFAALFFADTALPGFGVSANQLLAPLFFGSVLSYWIRGRSLKLETRWLPVLAVAALYYAVSAATGENSERGLLHMRYAIIYFLLAVSVAKILVSERAILALAWIVAGMTLVAALHGFAQAAEKNILAGVTGRWTDAVRVRGTAKNSIVFGWNMVFAVPFGFLLYSELGSAKRRFLALACTFAAVAAASLTFNRQTYIVIALSIGLSAVLFQYRNRKAVLAGVAVLGILGAMTVFPMILQRLLTVREVGKDPSFLERRDSFLMGMEMFRTHPVFGVGLGSFPAVWKEYIPADIPTYYVQYMHATRLRFPDFGYMALLAETGLVGLGTFLGLLGTAGWRAWSLRRHARTRNDPFLSNFASMVLVLIAYVGATSAIQDTLLYPRVWIVFGLALLCDARIWRRPLLSGADEGNIP